MGYPVWGVLLYGDACSFDVRFHRKWRLSFRWIAFYLISITIYIDTVHDRGSEKNESFFHLVQLYVSRFLCSLGIFEFLFAFHP